MPYYVTLNEATSCIPDLYSSSKVFVHYDEESGALSCIL